MILTFAASVLLLLAVSMLDMAVGVAKRHGWRYAGTELGGALLLFLLAAFMLWVEYGPA